MTEIPRVLGSRYEVGDLIGRGGMAEVHRGYDTRLSRTVAIKILRADLAQDATFLARFRREAQSAAALNHPSIVSVYDTGEESVVSATGQRVPLPYIVMELVKGRTVASLLEGGDPVPIGEAVQIVVGVLAALEYSHREGIIHRDIKPGNIMLTTDGKVKVMDFGIARAIADSAATMTQTNSVVGTAQYLSPEQARGEVVDARSDLYSTGCVLYELLTGRPPFVGDSAVAVAYQHVSETPQPASQIAPDIPDAIDRVIMKALAKNREERYQTAAEFRNDLLAAARGEGVSAPAVGSWAAGAAGAAAGLAAGAATQAYGAQAGAPTQAYGAPTQAYGAQTAQQYAGAGPYGAAGYPTNQQLTQNTATQAAVGGKEEEESPAKKSRWAIWLAVVLLVVAAAVGAWLIWGNKSPEPEPTPTATQAQLVSVPDLAGMTESQAKREVENAGLVFKRGTDQASDSIAKGEFVSADPAVGARVEAGSTVTVRFSSGPSAVTVPDVTGMTFEQARSALENANLSIGDQQQVNDPSTAKDRIVATVPASGERVSPNTQVTVHISTGLTTVPDVTGMSPASAQQELSAAGLTVINQIEQPVQDESLHNVVVDTSIEAGRAVSQGTQVTIYVGNYRQPAPEPTREPGVPQQPGENGRPTEQPEPSPTPTQGQN
ncbi:serine/threonine protein kinase [Actinobaculum suis]|uniref:non-specific serine/threonine protein kinase n=1 Tax=Actinobaculum suis TaxID=1657 RepID=A0A0K9ESN1_9ACTO|nr:Stk1 family PASTA domain-containing Ser/Thr kinase [Actinobaculum suis]KMY23194.1 serine/threonine protein kinase [Actinobaculum suis]MDY5152668.1 Stk1 family PASTA domain-containing Ser/Thr kinase [Actinobaculum suis]SDE10479.1 serine/threonine protein kinase [Actinobaculum suis]VDG75379.1 protein kinase [Actinobaculum suis]